MSGDRRKTWPRRLILGLFICYLIVIFVLIFYKGWGGIAFVRDNYASFELWKESISYSLNLVPLRFIFDAGGYTARTWMINVCGNIAMFIPMGIFVPVLFPKTREWSWGQIILKAVLLIAVIELVQMLLMCGQGDVDDIILNGLGICIGSACVRLPGVKERLSRF